VLTTDHLLQAFAAAGASAGILYVSVPITSGRREVTLLDELGTDVGSLRREHRRRWLEEVVAPNTREARALAERLRAEHRGTLVVDPAEMAVEGWAQDDYNAFWVVLMERHASLLAAGSGWELSRGARGEIGFGVALGLPIVDANGHALDIEDLRAMDRAAHDELAARGWPRSRIQAYLPALRFEDKPHLEPSAASQVFEWLIREREYQVQKFGTELDDEHTREGLGEASWWWRQLTTYYHRAHVLTLETPVGRQALAKFTATACGLLESVVRRFGPLPPPGVSSGELHGRS